MQRPLPPFRAEPSRRPSAPKRSGSSGAQTEATSIKARRQPMRFASALAPQPLKVLGRKSA